MPPISQETILHGIAMRWIYKAYDSEFDPRTLEIGDKHFLSTAYFDFFWKVATFQSIDRQSELWLPQ